MKTRIIRIIVLTVIVAAVVTGLRWYKFSGGNDAGPELKIYGNVDLRDASLAFNEQERIAAVLVEEGDRVAAGQVLARLKTNRLEAQMKELDAKIAAQREVVKRLETGTRPQEIEQARARVTAAQTMVRNALRNYERMEQTSRTGATSRQTLDDAKSRLEVERAQLLVAEKDLNLALEGPRKEDIAAARNSLAALEAALGLLEIRVSDMTLVSPESGVIRSRILEPGEMAGPARPVVTLALTDPKWVRAYVPEPNLGHVREGMKARVFSDSLPEEPVDGWVGFISPTAEFTPKTVQTEDLRTSLVYEVRVYVHDEKDVLRLGMPVTVVLQEAEESGEQRAAGN